MFQVLCGAGLVLALCGAASASPVTLTGDLWINQLLPSQNAVIGSVPGTTPDVTFQVTSVTGIAFSSYFGAGNCGLTCGNGSASYTVGTFLSNGQPAATNIVQNTPGALANTFDSSILTFTGTVDVTTGEQFTITHDDGASFYINGTIIPGISAGPTSATVDTITYTGPTLSGATLEMVYGECCGAPAVFATNIPNGGINPAPEPSSLLLLGPGLLGLVGIARRRLKAL